MNNIIIPTKLKRGDTIRVIAPARSMGIIGDDLKKFANDFLERDLGLIVEFGAHTEDDDEAHSSPISSRVADIHDAFLAPHVKAIFTVIGGFNSNQLLEAIDWDLIKNNPKIFCGYSDITALSNAIFAKTGVVTYSGPHYSTFGQKYLSDYTVDYLKKCLFEEGAFSITPSKEWTDDRWYKNQDLRTPIHNEGYWVLQEGEATGRVIGGNLCTLNLLQGTPFMPMLNEDGIFFLEDDGSVGSATFDRDLESLLQTETGKHIKGLVIGRFQNESEVTRDDLIRMIESKHQLVNIPVVANVDFGHTDPMVTLPIGGSASLSVKNASTIITIEEH